MSLKIKLALAALLAATAFAAVQRAAPPAEAAVGVVPKRVDAWAFCGVRPSDPTAQATANSMAAGAGITATFGPCNDPLKEDGTCCRYPYSVQEPGLRYVDPPTYMQVVQINAQAGMKTLVFDKRVYSTNKADRDAAFSFWYPVLEHIQAWDLGDEYDPRDPAQWTVLKQRWSAVLDDITKRTGIMPFTNHLDIALDEALRDLPGTEKLVSFTHYTDDLGASFARSFNPFTADLKCGINAYRHFTYPNWTVAFTPTVDSIRNGMQSLIAAGCDSFLVFGGARVYDTTGYDPVSLAKDGQPTDWATAVKEGSGRSSYTPVLPARLLETRSGLSTVDGQGNGLGRRAADSITEVQVGGRAGVRTNAVAAVLNITVTGASSPGYITAYACDSPRPNAAQVTYPTAVDTATAVIVKLSANGRVCLYTLAETDLVVDVNGYVPIGSTFTAVNPARLLETRIDPGLATVDGAYLGVGFRGAGSVTELQVTGRGGIPFGASDVILNVTVTNVRTDGFVTVFPCGVRPNASHVNFTVGSTVTNAVVAPLREDGRLCIYTLTDIDLVIDASGYYPAKSAFVSLVPTRVLDTRITPALPVEGIELAPAVREDNPPIVLAVAGQGGVPATATAVVLNVTVTEPQKAGFVTIYPCGEDLINASNVNFAAGATVANLVVAEVGQRGAICIHRSVQTQVIVDVTNFHP